MNLTHHHAHLVQGVWESEKIKTHLLKVIETELGVTTTGNPDFVLLEKETFGVEEARLLQEAQLRKPVSDKQVFVLTWKSITHEAQNALLKVLEEPTADTYFFLVTHSTETLLPTLRSRCNTLSAYVSDSATTQTEAKDFLMLSSEDRLVQVKKITEAKDKDAARMLLEGIELQLHKLFSQEKTDGRLLSTILTAKKQLTLRGASIKLILEHIALVLPRGVK